MAYKDSDQIATDSNYALGEYSFRLERTSVPGSSNDKIEVICTDKDGKNARKSIQVPSNTQVYGWYVEANETEASVYVTYEYQSQVDISPFVTPINCAGSGHIMLRDRGFLIVAPAVTMIRASQRNVRYIVASDTDGTFKPPIGESERFNNHVTFNGKTVYYTSSNLITDLPGGIVSYDPSASDTEDNWHGKDAQIAWTMIYGNEAPGQKTTLIGRFAIDIEDAGGVGPGGGIGGGWTDPGDYDEDWEEGDPTHTLYVTVAGALSGRHNDPIEDPSYSYIPADKETVKDYGCGGDGGHGGGGGAGASTVVIHKFATNQANSKEVTAIARRHGYGSGGGKGGKGGDGCILVYY